MRNILIGVLTPSSNTSLEPLTCAMVSNMAEVSIHYARFSVTEISLETVALNQFNETSILEAAKLLADAHVDVIAWNGTSSGWLGFESDVNLCESIIKVTGIPACTSVLALNEIMKISGCHKFGLVSPYLDNVQKEIIRNYASIGIECVAEQHLNKHMNFEFCQVTEIQLHDMVEIVSKSQPDCISTFCTNLKAAQLVHSFESEFGIPVYDTVSTAMWKALQICGVDTRRVTGWGSLFSEVYNDSYL